MKCLLRATLAGAVMATLVACAPTQTLDVWKDEGYNEPLKKILVIAVTQQDTLRHQFENGLADRLTKRGVHAVASHKVFPELGPDLDRKKAHAKVDDLGVDSILVVRSIDAKEITNHQYGGYFFAPTSVKYDGWHSYYTGSFVLVQRSYDTAYYTLDTTIYNVGSSKPIWHYLARTRVEGSKQGAISKLMPTFMEELEKGDLLP